jgi:hypothetical protein
MSWPGPRYALSSSSTGSSPSDHRTAEALTTICVSSISNAPVPAAVSRVGDGAHGPRLVDPPVPPSAWDRRRRQPGASGRRRCLRVRASRQQGWKSTYGHRSDSPTTHQCEELAAVDGSRLPLWIHGPSTFVVRRQRRRNPRSSLMYSCRELERRPHDQTHRSRRALAHHGLDTETGATARTARAVRRCRARSRRRPRLSEVRTCRS